MPYREPSNPMSLALVLAAITPLLPAASTADDTDSDAAIVEEVVVVANKHERSRREITANVSVFDDEDFRFELASSIADIFRYAPGIDYESDRSRFGAESINIRGIAGNRVAILLDGVPVSDQFDVGSFSNATRDLVNAGFVQNIEVLHGPASALYGSSAIGGVVAMKTIDPRHLARQRGHGGRFVSNWRDDDSSLTATAMHAVASDSLAVLAGLSGADGHESEASAADTNLDRRDFRNRSALIKLAAIDDLGNSWRATLYRKEGCLLYTSDAADDSIRV